MVHPAIPPGADSPNLLNGLIAKRAEIAGQLEANRRDHLRLLSDLKVVDDTIRLFQPDVDLALVRPKPVPVEHAAEWGEVTAAVYEALRDANAPLTALDLAIMIMRQRQLDTADANLVRLIRRRVGACLAAKRDQGHVVSLPLRGRRIAWTVAHGE